MCLSLKETWSSPCITIWCWHGSLFFLYLSMLFFQMSKSAVWFRYASPEFITGSSGKFCCIIEWDRKSDADLCNTVWLNAGLLQKDLSDALKVWFVIWLSAGQYLGCVSKALAAVAQRGCCPELNEPAPNLELNAPLWCSYHPMVIMPPIPLSSVHCEPTLGGSGARFFCGSSGTIASNTP